MSERKKAKREGKEIDPPKEEEEVIKTAPVIEEEPQQSGNSLAPQLKIIDGRIQVDPTTLIVAQQTEDIKRGVVHENVTHVTSATYSKRSRSDKWTDEEIKTFYNALRQCGTDFSMICKFFKNRTRTQIKNRFKKEEEVNPDRIDKALRDRLPLDVEFLKSVCK